MRYLLQQDELPSIFDGTRKAQHPVSPELRKIRMNSFDVSIFFSSLNRF
jgi:hypothetical protein